MKERKLTRHYQTKSQTRMARLQPNLRYLIKFSALFVSSYGDPHACYVTPIRSGLYRANKLTVRITRALLGKVCVRFACSIKVFAL